MNPYKIIIGALAVVIVIMGVFLFIRTEDMGDLKRETNELKFGMKQREAEIKERDRKIRLTRDTLELVYQVMTNAQIESRKAHMLVEKQSKEHEKIIFVPIANDSLRDVALSKLYTSYRPF